MNTNIENYNCIDSSLEFQENNINKEEFELQESILTEVLDAYEIEEFDHIFDRYMYCLVSELTNYIDFLNENKKTPNDYSLLYYIYDIYPMLFRPEIKHCIKIFLMYISALGELELNIEDLDKIDKELELFDY